MRAMTKTRPIAGLRVPSYDARVSRERERSRLTVSAARVVAAAFRAGLDVRELRVRIEGGLARVLGMATRADLRELEDRVALLEGRVRVARARRG